MSIILLIDLGSGRNLCTSHILSNPSIKRFENCPVRGTGKWLAFAGLSSYARGGGVSSPPFLSFPFISVREDYGKVSSLSSRTVFPSLPSFFCREDIEKAPASSSRTLRIQIFAAVRLGARRRPIGFYLSHFWRRSDNVAVTGAANRPSTAFWWRESCHFFRTCANIDSFVRVTDVIRRKTWNLNGTRPFLF